jgi:putative ABC transport system permease protein
MLVRSTVAQLLRDVKSQRLRTFLTTLGILWGTLAVSLLLAFGQGLHRKMLADMRGLGDGIVIGFPMRTSLPFEGLGKGRAVRLTADDMALVRQRVGGLRGISEELRAELPLRWRDRTTTASVAGVVPVFGAMRTLIPRAGSRFLNPLDEAERRRVAFLGDKIAAELFGEEDPVGATVTLGASPFLVVGVMVPKEQNSNYRGRDENMVYVPAATLRGMTGDPYFENFIFQASDVAATPAVKREVVETLARRQRFDPADVDAVMLWDTTEMFQFMDTFMLAFKLFLGVVGSLTLVVGGIGVSNIMSVVVEERTREIGVKMALGARQRFILVQLLLESLLVTAVGGFLGLVAAQAACVAIPLTGLEEYVGLPRVSLEVGLLTVAILGAVGFLAGYFPAREAAGLDPVVAMKL